MKIVSAIGIAAAAAAMTCASSASGVIVQGTYTLSNHPDGSAQPPRYGMRMDELYNATGGHDQFTFDFDHPASDMRMDYLGSTIRIYGTSYGGRDIGAGYAADTYLGFYTIDFLYDMGVGLAAGDDDVLVNAADHINRGTIMTPLGDTFNLADHRGGNPFSFRFGDENNDLGHRGHPGLSGWGWLAVVRADGTFRHVNAMDWLFTGEFLIPTPGAAGLLGLMGLAALRRRR